jgi:hypothetical protein
MQKAKTTATEELISYNKTLRLTREITYSLLYLHSQNPAAQYYSYCAVSTPAVPLV